MRTALVVLAASVAAALTVFAPAATTAGSVSTAGSVIVNGQGWKCVGPVDLDLVKVTNPPGDAINLGSACTGRIGRVEVDTWTNDGIKTPKTGPRNLRVESGYITCHSSKPGAHQDGIQAQGGTDLTFTLDISCPWSNANFFVSGSGATRVVCDGCNLLRRASHTATINGSYSGVRESTVCPDRTFSSGSWLDGNGRFKVNDNNVLLPAGDPRCA